MTNYTLYWTSYEAGQSDINMGTFNTRKEAEDGRFLAELNLIGQAADQEQRDKIVAGWWRVDENKED